MEVYQESVSDIPLLSHYIDQSSLVCQLNTHYPVHGNWVGPDIGILVKGWLLYIISECDHRLYTVEDWARGHLHTLRVCLGDPSLQASAFQDDRLGKILEIFSQDESWETFQGSYTGELLRLYSLETDIVRVDSVNVPSYRSSKEGSLFQYGHHKKHQADTVQLKAMLLSLDPLSLPLSVYTVAGNRNDEILYVPTIKQAELSLGKKGILYVGDSKMANLTTSSYLVSGQNYYLNPLSEPFLSKKDLEKGIERALADAQNIISIMEEQTEDNKALRPQLIAKVYELPKRQRTYTPETQEEVIWEERVALILSPPHAQSEIQDLDNRLQSAQKELLERFLPRKHRHVWLKGNDKDEKNAQAFVDNLLEKKRLKGLLEVEIIRPKPQTEQIEPQTEQNDVGQTKQQAKKRGKKQPKIKKVKEEQPPLSIRVKPLMEEIDKVKSYAGWRAYGTNAPVEKLPTTQILKCYREQFRIEHQFHRLLTKTTDLLPIYLKDELRIKALIRVLILALQFVSIIQHTARETLNENKMALTDIVPGNKRRKVEKPTTEALLKRFKNISIVHFSITNQQPTAVLTNFDPIHQIILNILRCPDDLYDKFTVLFNMSMN
jgi:transposase